MTKTNITAATEYFANITVDTIQTAKKIAVDTYVKHEGLAKSLNDFVEAQTAYTKQAINTGIDTGSKVFDIFTDKSFYVDTIKSVQEMVSKFAGKKAD